MTTYAQQFMALSDQQGNPVEVFNGSRLASRLANSNLCGSKFSNVAPNAGCAALAYVPGMPSALSDPVLWIDARDGSPTQQRVPNRGSGGSQLSPQLGVNTGVGTDEPLWLGGSGNYLYTPGLGGNTATLPNSAAVAVTGDIEIIIHVAMDSWNTAAYQILLSKYTAAGQGYEVGITNGGAMYLFARLAASDVTYVATVFPIPAAVNGSDLWLRYTRVAATGVTTFYTSPGGNEGVPTTWGQVGPSLTSTAGAMVAGTNPITIASRADTTGPVAAKFYRVIVRSAIGAANPVNAADIDFTKNTSQTAFVATTGGTVTINRGAVARKTVTYMGRPLWLFGYDDYMMIPDNDLLDFDLNDRMTVMLVMRAQNNLVQVPISKETAFGSPSGWTVYYDGAAALYFFVDDPAGHLPFNGAVVSPAAAPALHVFSGSRGAGQMSSTLNGVPGTAPGSPSSDFTTGSLANSLPTFIGRDSGGSYYTNMELTAVMVWRRVLSQAEISAVNTYYQSTPSTGCWTPLDLSTTGDPWYNANVPASTEAFGFWIEEWTGLDGAHHHRSSSPVGGRRGGAEYGPQSHDARVWKLNVLLHGSSERGLNYLFRWLEQTLLDCCNSACGTRKAWLREVCPSSLSNLDEGYARAENVALLDGPTWEDSPVEDSGCYLRRVSFTLGVGSPCLYRDQPGSVSGDSTNVGVVSSASIQNAGCDTWVNTNRRVQADLPIPDIGQVAPIITITSSAGSVGSIHTALPALRIVGYADPNNTGDPCRAIEVGEFILEGSASSGLQIVVDMVQRRVFYRDLAGGNYLTDGGRFIGASIRPGVQRWWSLGGCDSGFVIVEPAYKSLQTLRYLPNSYDRVTPAWNVKIESGIRFGCC